MRARLFLTDRPGGGAAEHAAPAVAQSAFHVSCRRRAANDRLDGAVVSQLQELSLATEQGFITPGLAPLRAAPLLRKLSVQMLDGAPALTAADGRARAGAALPELRELQLQRIGHGFVAALAAAPWLGRLESLEL